MFNAHEFLVLTKVAKMFGGFVRTSGELGVDRRVEVHMVFRDCQRWVAFDAVSGGIVFYVQTSNERTSVPQEWSTNSGEWYAHLRLACSVGVVSR